MKPHKHFPFSNNTILSAKKLYKQAVLQHIFFLKISALIKRMVGERIKECLACAQTQRG